MANRPIRAIKPTQVRGDIKFPRHQFNNLGSNSLPLYKEVKIMPSKQSSSKVSTLASKVLSGQKPTIAQAKTLAASVLSQDEKRGQKP